MLVGEVDIDRELLDPVTPGSDDSAALAGTSHLARITSNSNRRLGCGR
jgi:hypothetical protein